VGAARQARQNGARIIALTNRSDSPLGWESDVALCANLDGLPWAGENAVARLVQLSVLDALLSTVAQKDYAAAQANLGRTTAALGRSGFRRCQARKSPTILRWAGPLTSHAYRIRPAGLYFQRREDRPGCYRIVRESAARASDGSPGAIRHPTFSLCFVWRCAGIGGATDRTIAWQQNSEYPVVLKEFR
jgi:hypothetical protein